MPNLDMQMSTRVRDYDITVSLTGPPDRLKLQYHSEPPLPEADIVSLLALGRTREESAQQQGNSAFGGDASGAILSQALNATVSSRVQNLFGGSRIKIDPQGLSTETTTSHGPQVTIEQQVTNQADCHLQHERLAIVTADHSNGIQRFPQSIHRSLARSKRNRQLRCSHPSAQKVIRFSAIRLSSQMDVD